jgi:uncharacterized protein YraI
MPKDTTGRLLGGVAVIALMAAVAGCARNPPPPPAYPPPPVAMTPPPAYGPPSRPAAKYLLTSALHLRSGPSVESTVVGTLPSGTQVQATGSQQGGWWEVQTPDGTGWVSSRYLSPT